MMNIHELADFLEEVRRQRAVRQRRDIRKDDMASWFGVPPTTYSPWTLAQRPPDPRYFYRIYAALYEEDARWATRFAEICGMPDPLPDDHDLRFIVKRVWPRLSAQDKGELKRYAERLAQIEQESDALPVLTA